MIDVISDLLLEMCICMYHENEKYKITKSLFQRVGGKMVDRRWCVLRMLDLRLLVEGSIPIHDTAWLFLR